MNALLLQELKAWGHALLLRIGDARLGPAVLGLYHPNCRIHQYQMEATLVISSRLMAHDGMSCRNIQLCSCSRSHLAVGSITWPPISGSCQADLTCKACIQFGSFMRLMARECTMWIF